MKIPKSNFAIFYLVVITSMLPYIGIIRFPSDVQPYYFLLACLGLLLSNGLGRKQHVLILPFFCILFLATVSLFFSLGGEGSTFSLFRTYYGYLASTIVFMYYLKNGSKFSHDNLHKVYDVILVIIYIGFVLNILGLSWINQLFVNRNIFDYEQTGRGLVSFFTEQSQVPTAMSILLILYLHCEKLDFKRFFLLIFGSLIAGVGQIFVELIALVGAYSAGVFLNAIFTGKIRSRHLKYSLAVVVFLISSLVFLVNTDVFKNNRAINILKDARTELLYTIGTDDSILYKISGVTTATATLIDDPFVFQLDSSNETKIEERIGEANDDLHIALFGVSNAVYPPRVYSAFGSWIVDFGILGFLFYLAVMGSFLYIIVKTPHEKKHIVYFSFIYLLYITFIKPPLSDPSLFLLFASTYHYTKKR